MPLRKFSADEARIDPLLGRTVGVIGYGSQGHAHALNLRDSGCRVIVGQRPGQRFEEACAAGFETMPVQQAVARSDLLILGLPDDRIPTVFEGEIRPHLRAGQTLGFMHGFVMHYGLIKPPAGVDVVLVAPKAQGHGLRRLFVEGRGAAALVAVAQDASRAALSTALAWAAGIGASRAAIFQTTFRDETETDLFGEQAVLCGGISSLVTAAFETLVARGYPQELAYFECCHELKLLADLIHEGGITHMRRRISSTARYGDLTRGPRIVDAAVRQRLERVLDEIQSGEFAREFLADAAAGNPNANSLLERGANHPIERAGDAVRGPAV